MTDQPVIAAGSEVSVSQVKLDRDEVFVEYTKASARCARS